MYVPAHFAEPDTQVLLDFIEAHPLGVLVTAAPADDGAPSLFATHLPLVLDRTRGTHGVLQGHVARANPHVAHAARAATAGGEALVIFAGPDAYVTPSWYASKQEHGRVVPTWNYVAVHATGTVRIVDDADFLLRHLAALTARHEAGREHPWATADAPAGYIERQAQSTVGVEIDVTRLEGKWKMSQNRTAADIAGVVAGLAASPAARDQAVAALVNERRPPSKHTGLAPSRQR